MAEIAEKVERPLATLSLGTGPRTAVVTDAKLIPEVYWRRAIDKRSYCAASRLARWKAPSFPTAPRS